MQQRKVDMTGERYGKLLILREVDSIRYDCGKKERMWECKCDCGKIVVYSQSNIRSGNSRSCGCSKAIDLTGRKFGKLSVICKDQPIQKEDRKVYKWICKCDCGNTVSIRQSSLLSGATKSCGCITKNKKYGDIGKHRLKDIWHSMRERCENPNHKSYKHYGLRNIGVCEEWKDPDTGYIAFYNWAMNNGYKIGLTIDRIDVNGNYTPDNCRWISNLSQQRNKRTNRYVEYNGEVKCISEWAEIYNLKTDTLSYRLKHGWDIEKALKTPARRY